MGDVTVSVSTTLTVTFPDPVGAEVGATVCVGAWVGLSVRVQDRDPGREKLPVGQIKHAVAPEEAAKVLNPQIVQTRAGCARKKSNMGDK